MLVGQSYTSATNEINRSTTLVGRQLYCSTYIYTYFCIDSFSSIPFTAYDTSSTPLSYYHRHGSRLKHNTSCSRIISYHIRSKKKTTTSAFAASHITCPEEVETPPQLLTKPPTSPSPPPPSLAPTPDRRISEPPSEDRRHLANQRPPVVSKLAWTKWNARARGGG